MKFAQTDFPIKPTTHCLATFLHRESASHLSLLAASRAALDPCIVCALYNSLQSLHPTHCVSTMLNRALSRMGWRDDTSSGADDATANPPSPSPPPRLPGPARRARNFSETEFMDSGLARTFDSAGSPTIDELKASEYDGRFFEEIVLSKLQEVQRRLQLVRERKDAILGATNGVSTPEESLGRTKRRLSERLFVASLRLPMSVELDEEGNVSTSVSTTQLGLVAAFHDLLEAIPIRWLGAPGRSTVHVESMDADQRAKLRAHFSKRPPTKLMSLLKYVPVFTPADDAFAHSEFCNSVIWPLFHYMPLSFEGERTFHVESWECFVRINQLYCDSLIEEFHSSGIDESDAMFWMHDLHLMLVPRMLRDRLPKARIGFFLHTPFPAGEVFRTFPERRALLEGMLGSDLLGFHTYDYARHFLSACERILGLDVKPNGVDDKGLFVRVGIYPYGIDANTFKGTMKKMSVNKRVRQIRAELPDKKIIIGVDRLDYIKGIPHKMLAIEHLLETHPEWIGKLVLLQVTAPSNSMSEEYMSFRAEILELVGRINGRFATIEDMPILYRECFMTFDEMCALYASADVAVMTSLRDGMNLASYEYIMCQTGRNGALVLSEFMGAAQNLPGAILCNPWDIEGVSEAIHRSLTMNEVEREIKYQKLERYVTKHTAAKWGVNFIEDLEKQAAERKKAREKLVKLPASQIAASYAAETKGTRLLLLDYDGTLRQYESQPELAEPSERLLALLARLTECERNLVFIVTGRQKGTMVEWMNGIGVGFAVEHGFSLRWPDHLRPRFGGREDLAFAEEIETGDDVATGSSEWDDLLSPRDLVLMRETLEMAGKTLRQIEDYTPTSFVTTKESAYSWHFRDADPDFAGSRALDARNVLEQIVVGSPMEVLMGQKILYVRPRGVHKGAATEEILRRLRKGNAMPSWILSIGDDRTDEDMFNALNLLPEKDVKVTTCTVGRKTTSAKYYVNHVDDVVSLLEQLEEAV